MPSAQVRWHSDRIVCLLPITQPTSKVRVKRGGMPLATRQNILKAGDLIEWQISYRDNEMRLSELGKMLQIGCEKGVLAHNDFDDIRGFGQRIQTFFDECYDITLTDTEKMFLDEFTVLMRNVPIIRKELEDGCFVEGELKHKQRAVGYQPMLYVFIPIENVESNEGGLMRRPAVKKEVVEWKPSAQDIIGIARTFIVLSRNHKNDILDIIKDIM